MRISRAVVFVCCLAAEQASAESTTPAGSTAPSHEPAPDPALALPEASSLADPSQQSRQPCVEAHERGQVLRLDGSLMESRKTLKACSVEACPLAVQRDCVLWLEEVSGQIPTVVFEAITATGAAQRVKVMAAHQLVTEELDGRPIEMDPGYYEFRFELDGHPPKVALVLLKQGEKNRLVSVDFRDEAKPPVPASSPAPVPQAGASKMAAEPPLVRPVPMGVYVVGGMAIASAAAATVLGLNTRRQESSALEECAPRCSERRIDSIKRSALLTDAALGATAVSAAVAIALYLVGLEAPSTQRSQGWWHRVNPRSGWRGSAGWTGFEAAF